MTMEEFELTRRKTFVESYAEQENARVGRLDGNDCPKCKNKGYVYTVDYDALICVKETCECMQNRKMQALAQHSGLGALLDVCKFDRYYHNGEKWREGMFNRARDFLQDDKALFYIGGQVGCGKSFLCVAMVNEYIKQGIDCKFAVWCDVVTTLKQSVMQDSDKYNELLTELQQATVLYIDDFFKTTPTSADIDKAFQIINYRYNQSRISGKRYVTLISSERTASELLAIDEAIATRITELATPKYMLTVSRGANKNLRTNGKLADMT